jgi:3-hydroxyisobutyrate dehydrogenase-like beta-hydroxyacid dehydrogenase
MATIGIVGLACSAARWPRACSRPSHAVVGHDVRAERVAALEALGGRPAASVTAVARASEAVITLLPSLAPCSRR